MLEKIFRCFRFLFAAWAVFIYIPYLAAQEKSYPSVEFIPPIEGQLLLSGTFGELRSNHFHAGVDIKTGGVEGKPVYAIADGYVSRIKVSTGGYGKVLYITHPNGFVSVYGHLQRFNDSIQQYVTAYQYEQERFVVEKFPASHELVVKQGEMIAYSGNTGGSTAPHLHFEIREEATQYPVNPLFFEGIRIEDYYRPKLHELVIYPVDEYSRINGSRDTAYFSLGGWGEQHYLNGDPKINVSGRVSFGIRCHDPMNHIPNRNGVYSVDLYRDSTRVFGLEMDKISFSTTRYLNSLIDYGYFKKTKRRVIRTQVDTNNRLFNYRDVLTNGILDFSDSSSHTMTYVVKDVYGNTSRLVFGLLSMPSLSEDEEAQETVPPDHWFRYDAVNTLEKNGIRLEFPANAFYRSFPFRLSEMAGDSNMYSPVYVIHDKYMPVHKSFDISIKPFPADAAIEDRLYIAIVGDNGQHWYIGSGREKDRITAKSRLLGNYVVMADTVSPEIDAVNVSDGKDISQQSSIQLRIRDRQTGIGRFRGELNGRWILMEYEPKKELLFYQFDDRLVQGKNVLKVVVTDQLGNEQVYQAVLHR